MRAGLVGYGKGGRYLHATRISSLPGATFVGVVTRSAERKQEVAKDLPGVATFATLADLVAAGADVVVISTPLASRRALILEAIELGFGDVSAKPFATDAVPALELAYAADRRGVLLGLYQDRRWDSDVR
ncbi:Gfo/Idh/MocA family oxidoreductase, partial [Pseudomonas syringae]